MDEANEKIDFLYIAVSAQKSCTTQNRVSLRNLDLRVQFYEREFWASNSAGADSTKSFIISGSKR